MGGSGFDRQLNDLSSNPISSSAFGSSAVSSGHQTRKTEREQILGLSKPPELDTTDDDEDRQDSSSIIPSKLNHIRMPSDITDSHISNRSKSTGLSMSKIRHGFFNPNIFFRDLLDSFASW